MVPEAKEETSESKLDKETTNTYMDESEAAESKPMDESIKVEVIIGKL